jgi:diacylglycerol diphosphate phosphatase / phosphatidate phosphatase
MAPIGFHYVASIVIDAEFDLPIVILSLALTGAITNILKIFTGRPRPDLIDRCAPQAGAQNPPIFGLVDASICTQTDQNIMKDGWRSFASGHSSCTSY